MINIPWPVVKARLQKTLELEARKLESTQATLEELRVVQGRISVCKELLQLEKDAEANPPYSVP